MIMQEKLINLLCAISENAERRFVFLSEHREEWEELKPYVLEKARKWNVYDEHGNVFLGRLFNRLMRYYVFDPEGTADSNPVPFHCYEITPGEVVFTDKELEWSDAEGRYVGVMADVIRDMSNAIRNKKDSAHTPTHVQEDSTSQPRSGSGCMVIIIALAVVSLTVFFMS